MLDRQICILIGTGIDQVRKRQHAYTSDSYEAFRGKESSDKFADKRSVSGPSLKEKLALNSSSANNNYQLSMRMHDYNEVE